MTDAAPSVEDAASAAHLRPVTTDDLRQTFERLITDAAQYPRLQPKMAQWRAYVTKLIEFQALQDFADYTQGVRDELALYARLVTLRRQAEDQRVAAAIKLCEQAEQLLLADAAADRVAYHRAAVLVDAAQALCAESRPVSGINQVFAAIASPQAASRLLPYGLFAAYFVGVTVLGLQILYVPDADFGALAFRDYLSLLLWTLGLEGARNLATNLYATYFDKD